MPPDNSNPQLPTDPEWDTRLAEVEQAVADLKARRDQVARDRRDRERLLPELRRLEARLGELELALESRLMNWRSVREPFWDVVRFGGVGVLLGWLLKSCAG